MPERYGCEEQVVCIGLGTDFPEDQATVSSSRLRTLVVHLVSSTAYKVGERFPLLAFW